ADIVVDTCGREPVLSPVGFEAGIEIPAAPPGEHAFVMSERARSCPDTTVVSSDQTRLLTYAVLPDCGGGPIPPDSLVRTFVSLRSVPEPRGAGASVTLRFVKNGCPRCVHLVSFGPGPADALEGVVDWRPHCAEFACFAETLSTPLGQLAAGFFGLS